MGLFEGIKNAIIIEVIIIALLVGCWKVVKSYTGESHASQTHVQVGQQHD